MKVLLRLVSLSIFSRLAIFILTHLVHDYRDVQTASKEKSLLILNAERFEHDLDEIASNGRVRLLVFPSRIQTALNAIFIGTKVIYEVNSYVDKKIETLPLVEFISGLISYMHKKYDLCGIVTCSFYYRQDIPYEFASLKTSVPFYVLFKEYMKVDNEQKTLENYRDRKFKFYGKTIFCSNASIKRILLDSGVCKNSQVSVIGSPRFDAIFNKPFKPLKNQKKTVTLFSFLHASGGLDLGNDSVEGNFFSNDVNKGFYHLFDQVHSAIAELAMENPDIEYCIKTKWAGPWYDRITKSVLKNSGIDIIELKNLVLDSEEPAQALMKRSSVVVAFNSTTVIEACLLKKNLITPIFCEAKTKYHDTNVFFTKYFNSLLVASSKKDLKEKVDSLIHKYSETVLPHEMIEEYIFALDGKASERMINEILQD